LFHTVQALATAEGNLLENKSLIDSLSRTKEKSKEIEEALVKSADASVKLDEQREVYRPFASAGSKLFFLVKSLQAVCHMYQFSLSSFLALFKQSLGAEECKTAKTTEDRLEMLVRDLQVRVLYFVGRALFKTDRPMFALHLVRGMHADQFQPKEWEIFTGSLVASVSDAVPRGYPSWAPTERQAAFRLLSENLPHLLTSLELDNQSKWQRFAASLEAEKDMPLLRGVSPFQRVLAIQAFRPDRLQTALLNFCTELLRTESVSPPPLSLAALLAESDASTPLLLISSPGADASKVPTNPPLLDLVTFTSHPISSHPTPRRVSPSHITHVLCGPPPPRAYVARSCKSTRRRPSAPATTRNSRWVAASKTPRSTCFGPRRRMARGCA